MIIQLIVTVLILYVTWIMVKYVRALRTLKKYPNVMKPLPFFDCILMYLKCEPYVDAYRNSIEEGHALMTIYINKPIIFVNKLEEYLEIFVDNGSLSSERPLDVLFEDCNKHYRGIVDTQNGQWVQSRQISQLILGKLGMGKSIIEESVHEQISYVIERLNKTKELASLQYKQIFLEFTSDIIYKLMVGYKPFLHSKNLQEASKFCDDCETILQKTSNILLFVPLLLPLYSKEGIVKHLPFSTQINASIRATKYLNKEIADHKRNRLQPNYEDSDFIDGFLTICEKEGKNSNLNEEDLSFMMKDIFVAGVDPVSATIDWGCMLLACNQDVQSKMLQEIYTVVGADRMPLLSDLSSMPYIAAVVQEILRISVYVPTTLPHLTSGDITLTKSQSKLVVPKDTIIFGNLFAIARSPTVFEKPREFYPEHFLERGENGAVTFLTHKQKLVTSFAEGNRQCLGEHLARTELFLLFVSLIQRFTIKLGPECDINEVKQSLHRLESSGIVRKPKLYPLAFEVRS